MMQLVALLALLLREKYPNQKDFKDACTLYDIPPYWANLLWECSDPTPVDVITDAL